MSRAESGGNAGVRRGRVCCRRERRVKMTWHSVQTAASRSPPNCKNHQICYCYNCTNSGPSARDTQREVRVRQPHTPRRLRPRHTSTGGRPTQTDEQRSWFMAAVTSSKNNTQWYGTEARETSERSREQRKTRDLKETREIRERSREQRKTRDLKETREIRERSRERPVRDQESRERAEEDQRPERDQRDQERELRGRPDRMRKKDQRETHTEKERPEKPEFK